MLGSIVLLMCVAAGVAAVAILFILYGPVPVRRKVMIIPRMSAPDPFVDRPAAHVVALPHGVPPGASMPPSVAMPHAPMIAPHAPMAASHAPTHASMSAARADATMSRTASPPRTDATMSRTASPARAGSPSLPSTVPGSRARAATPDVAPLVLRRPGNPNPPPLSRARAARGTEPRPQPSPEEMHAIDTIDVMDDDQTSQVTLVHDDTFLEDGR